MGQIVAEPPGPNSRRLATLLRNYESRNITYVAADFPIFLSQASGANIVDVDRNIYVDLTGAFGVASTGHSNTRVAGAIDRQAHRLMHGMGDVHPTENKIALTKMLCQLTPGDFPKRVILATGGAEAIESAIKTAAVATGKPGVICFTGAYHGLTYGALAVTDRMHFKGPFLRQLGDFARRAHYPYCYRCPLGLEYPSCGAACLDEVEELLATDGKDIGAVLVEPMQGRAGDVPAPELWLQKLRRLCDEKGLVLILDEIFTGFGRTGRWFACEHAGIVPDIMCVGKGMSSGFPISACIGRADIMDCWPASDGEAIHTSTFLGHPTGCAAALASIAELREQHLIERVAVLEPEVRASLQRVAEAAEGRIGDLRGRGLMWGLECVTADGQPDGALAREIMIYAMRQGVLLLTGAPNGNVLSLAPPLVITREQLNFATEILRDFFVQ